MGVAVDFDRSRRSRNMLPPDFGVLKWPFLHFKSTFEQNLKFFLCLESKVFLFKNDKKQSSNPIKSSLIQLMQVLI